ncbi:protein CANDIDATE G-PROTEIN COUPLED RECEPTOR 2-like [Magnolia sinica]|uniref:protein CANDIDATE G-PROTEIN COUPLED RECEPTOR 2-like n=1 Tax=Magnolia sinica TaxID=86752 RepID=UPI00265B69AB|nr:protein CANDIDATE G-PROTEIN COUPLED RECEPTOR 2-like [Magnolia sinica]
MRRNLLQIAEIPLSFAPSSSDPSSQSADTNPKSPSWIFGCHGLWYNLALIVPSALFVAFLLSKARKSFSKLSHGRSYIMIAYYALLWIVSALNLAWCVLQVWQCSPGKELSWNVLSLFTTSGMLFLEISLVAFLLQGSPAGGLEALTQTFIISGVIVGVDILLKAIYVFGFGVPFFIDSDESTHRVKWGLWVVHKLLLTAVYGFILFMHHTKWRERLPARPAFYNYISMMFIMNAVALFACALLGNGAAFGFWLYDLTTVCYHSLYLPFLYVTFLADFFQEEDLHLENAYYSEMKDAGFFDADWD